MTLNCVTPLPDQNLGISHLNFRIKAYRNIESGYEQKFCFKCTVQLTSSNL